MIACFSFAHNQESLGMAPLCRFGSPYRFRQAMSFSWLKPNALQNQLSRSPLRCFQWLMKSTIWSRTDADTHCTFNSSPQSFFLRQYVRSATRQLPRLFEIVLLLGYQLRVYDCVLAEQCLWKNMRQTGKGLFLPVKVLIWMYSQVLTYLGYWNSILDVSQDCFRFLNVWKNLRRGHLDIRHLFQLV